MNRKSDKIGNDLKDGADKQSKETLMHLKKHIPFTKKTWNGEFEFYKSEVNIERWGDGSDQGYLVSLTNEKNNRLNIGFFGHGHTGDICAVKWEFIDKMLNIHTSNRPRYKDKWDICYSVSSNFPSKMSDWIVWQLRYHWINGMYH